MKKVKRLLFILTRPIVFMWDITLTTFGLIRKSQISERISKARQSEANHVRREYERKIKQLNNEHKENLIQAKDDYKASIDAKQDYYEKEMELLERKRIVELRDKDSQIMALNNKITSMTRMAEDAAHQIKSVQLIMMDIRAFFESTARKDAMQDQEFKRLTQRVSFVEQGLPETQFFEPSIKAIEHDSEDEVI